LKKEKVKRSEKAASPGEASSGPSLKEKIKFLRLLRRLQVLKKEKVKRSEKVASPGEASSGAFIERKRSNS
jgi:hypothetical protein